MSKLNVLILGFIRPRAIEHLVETLLNQSDETCIYISLDLAKKEDPNFELNVECIKLGKRLLKKEKIHHLRISQEPLGCYQGVFQGVSWFFRNVEIGLVLEEDLLIHEDITSVSLKCMKLFQHNSKLGSISLFAPEIEGKSVVPTKLYKTSFPSSWGWITTSSKWSQFIHTFNRFEFTFFRRGGIRGFRRWQDVMKRINKGTLDTWAYRWLFTHWKKSWYTLTPFPTGFIQNNGFDELATHTNKSKKSNLAIGTLSTSFAIDDYIYDSKKVQTSLNKYILEQRFGVFGFLHSIRRNCL